MPLVGGRCPFGVTVAARAPGPRYGFVEDQFAVAVPQRRPLRAGGHLVIAEHAVHLLDRIGELFGGINRLVVFIQFLGKDQRAEHRRCRRGRDCRGELGRHLFWDGRRIGHRRRVSDGWRQRERWRHRNRGRQGDGWGERDGGGGWVDAVSNRFRKGVHQVGHKDKHYTIHNLLRRLARHLAPADGTVRYPYPCEQQAHVVVNFRHRAHGRARIA